jgi:Na+-transporting methylmalonyl-CoA/oxaloacetate decarboxylase gamma subunit
LSSDFSTGLMVSIVGLSITFIALGVFIGVIYLLKILFPYKQEAEEEDEKEDGDESEEIIEGPVMVEAADEEIVAAIAAVTYLRGQTSTSTVPSKNPIWTNK